MTSTRNDHAIAPSEFARIAVNLLTYAHERNFEGVDPYDALNSPFANLLTLGTKPGRIILTPLLRRSPINFRPILRVKPAANPKALGLFLEGVVKLARLQRERKLNVDFDLSEIARAIVARLFELRSPNASGAASRMPSASWLVQSSTQSAVPNSSRNGLRQSILCRY